MSRRKDDPLLADIRERLARVEARLDGLDKGLCDVKDKIKNLDNRIWAILISVILTILLMLWKMLTP
jgi:archaellum component FlaC